MRVVYVTAETPCGSKESFILPEIDALVSAGVDVVVVPRSPDRGAETSRSELFPRTIPQPLISWTIIFGAVIEALSRPRAATLALALLLKSRSAKILLKNVSVFPKALWLSRYVRLNHVRHIHAHWAGTTATLAMAASIVSGAPWSFTAHRWDIVENNLFAVKSSRAKFTRFISESGLKLAESSKLFPANGHHSVHIIHMGVSLPEAKAACSRPTSNVFRILCPANLVPVKGHKYLLEAICLLQRRQVALHIQLAGAGELEGELRELARTLCIKDSVDFLGQVPHKELLDQYRRCEVDAVVLPSLDLGNGLHEGIPVSLIEAMAFNIPVISTDTGGIPELLREGAGLMVPPADAQALADAIESIIKNAALRESLGMTGQMRVRQEFDVRFTTAQLKVLLNGLTADQATGNVGRVEVVS